MCPMRVFLVLFSAMLAAYLAWRNYSKNEELSVLHESEEHSEDAAIGADKSSRNEQILSKVSSGFWVMVDMASGRYLWKSLKSLEATPELKER